MAFARPSLAELFTRIASDIETSLDIVGASLRNSFTRLMAKVLAGATHLLHGHLAWAADQIFPDKADAENLQRLAAIWGLTPNAATFAEGEVTFTGTDTTVIPAGTELVSSDGVSFITTEDATISGGEADASVRAKVAGNDGNALVGVLLTMSGPIAGVDAQATVSVEIANGSDAETTEELRTRLVDRIKEPPLGGAAVDYEQWAKEVTGVTRVWVYPNYHGPGTVGIYFVRDNDVSIWPSEAEVEAVSGYIETLRPVTANVYVYAPSGYDVGMSLQVTPNTEAVRDAINAEINDMFARDGEPGGTIYLSRINEAISVADGEFNHVLLSPSGNVTAPSGYIPQAGVIIYS